MSRAAPTLFPPRLDEGQSQPPVRARSCSTATILGRVPHFVVERDPAWLGSWRSLRTILTPAALPAQGHRAIFFFRHAAAARSKLSKLPFGASVLTHGLAIALFLYWPAGALMGPAAMASAADPAPEVIYYAVPVIEPAKTLPRMSPAPSASPARGGSAPRRAAAPSAPSRSTLQLVSHFAHPDNTRQTIYQSASAPDLKITSELKLPNIVIGPQSVAPNLPVLSNLNELRPNRSSRDWKAAAAPQLQQASAEMPKLADLDTPVSQPKLPVLPGAGALRPGSASRNWKATAAPQLTQTAQDMTGLSGLGSSSQPKLPVAGVAPMAAASTRGNGNGRGAAIEAPAIAGSANGPELIVMGLDPSAPVSPVALPPGNRYGEFSTAGGGRGSGSEGSGGGAKGAGAGGSASGSGSNGAGSGEGVGIAGAGNGSGAGRGAGAGSSGPEGAGRGGSGTEMSGPLTIGGAGGRGEAEGMLGSSVAAELLYPVVRHLNVRRNALVVSTGPMGGGGLEVYGVLNCGKIYTIFLPMPGANWTMQYCEKTSGPPQPVAQSHTAFIHLNLGLVPPDPDLASRVDFRRLPVPPEKAGKMIVLKGTLNTDGTVHELGVLQGVLPVMDEAARLAFSRWKFKPAIRNGKPVPVELLVGIPMNAASSAAR